MLRYYDQSKESKKRGRPKKTKKLTEDMNQEMKLEKVLKIGDEV